MNIKKVIREKGWTLERLAAEMKNKQGGKGVSHAAVSQIINGNPTIDKLQEIASIIGVTVSELVADEGKSFPSSSITCPNCGTVIPVKLDVWE